MVYYSFHLSFSDISSLAGDNLSEEILANSGLNNLNEEELEAASYFPTEFEPLRPPHSEPLEVSIRTFITFKHMHPSARIATVIGLGWSFDCSVAALRDLRAQENARNVRAGGLVDFPDDWIGGDTVDVWHYLSGAPLPTSSVWNGIERRKEAIEYFKLGTVSTDIIPEFQPASVQIPGRDILR